MSQQISLDDAFPVYQKRCAELFEETLLLRAQVGALERQLAEAQQANEQHPPVTGGPDLAGPLPYRDGEQP